MGSLLAWCTVITAQWHTISLVMSNSKLGDVFASHLPCHVPAKRWRFACHTDETRMDGPFSTRTESRIPHDGYVFMQFGLIIQGSFPTSSIFGHSRKKHQVFFQWIHFDTPFGPSFRDSTGTEVQTGRYRLAERVWQDHLVVMGKWQT